jgi:hypothetical protein
MTDVYCQINKMRLQKVASNELLVSGDALTLTEVVTFRPSGRIKLVTGTPEKGPKMVRGNWGGLGFHEFSKCES